MFWIKHPSRLTMLAIALALGLVINVSAQAQPRFSSFSNSIPTEWNFDPPPNTGTPVNREGGATRNPCIREPNPELTLTALVRKGTVGSTVSPYPSFSWYVPRTDAKKLRFVLKDANQNSVYETEFALKDASGGIASLHIPASASVAPLEIGKEYEWELTMICDPGDPADIGGDRSGNMVVQGWIKRVELSPTLASQLERATPEERLSLYATNRLWYNTLETLVQLRRMRPNDSRITDAWKKLLASVELNAIAQQPMFESPTQAVERDRNSSASSLQLR